MDHVVTMIGAAEGSLDAAIVAEARSALNALGAETAAPEWLAESLACDVACSGLDPEQAQAAALAALDGAAVDVIAQPRAGRRKRLLLADMESTVITAEMVDEIAARAGLGDDVADITRRAMDGELDFASALSERVAMLAGMDVAVLEAAAGDMVFSAGALSLVRTMAAAGAVTALVSGGFTFFTERIAARACFAEHRGNELEIAAGRLTGRVVPPVLGPDGKVRTLVELATREGLPMSETLAVGDGANDLQMVQAAGLGVAYRGKAVLRQAARARLDHADLAALLYAQGYRRDEVLA